MITDHLAREAARLKSDEIFNDALDYIRDEALSSLAAADVDDKTMILRLQQKVAVIDEIRSVLDRYIIMAGEPMQEAAGSYA